MELKSYMLSVRAQVPKIALIMRKAYGGAYIALVSKSLGYDSVIAWPSAEMAVMGAKQAVELLYSKKMDKMTNKEKGKKIEEYKKENEDVLKHVETDKIDLLIGKKDTREAIYLILDAFKTKSYRKIGKRHGNMPL